jgi:hypothetical protein
LWAACSNARVNVAGNPQPLKMQTACHGSLPHRRRPMEAH